MISSKQNFLAVVLPLATCISFGVDQSASARQTKCGDYTRGYSVPTGETYNQTDTEIRRGPNGDFPVSQTNTYNYTRTEYRTGYECHSDKAIGAVFNSGNGSPAYGVSVRYPLDIFYVTLRGNYFFTQDQKNRASLALTREIDLGVADVFIGGGYHSAIDSVKNKGFEYPFATVGVDYRITPSIDLNLGVLIPISGGSNTTNYNVGIALNF